MIMGAERQLAEQTKWSGSEGILKRNMVTVGKEVCKYKGNIIHSLFINDVITSGSNKQKYPSETSSETAWRLCCWLLWSFLAEAKPPCFYFSRKQCELLTLFL